MRRPRKRRWGNELERYRRARLADFEARKALDHDDGTMASARTIDGSRILYIPIHPFADEPSLLERLGMKPTDCSRVDAYWTDGHDANFVAIQTAEASGMAPGLTSSWWHDSPPQLHLWAVVDARCITRTTLETVLRQLVNHPALRTRVGAAARTRGLCVVHG